MIRPRPPWLCCAAFLIAGLACSLARAATEEVAVLDVRVAPHDDGTTRFVLELSNTLPFIATARDGQVVIDTSALDWRSGAAGLVRPVGLVNGFTYTSPKPGAGRLVIEIASGATLQKAFLIPPGLGPDVRLVIDLAPPFARESPSGPLPPSQTQAMPGPGDPLGGNPLTGHGRPPELSQAALIAPPAYVPPPPQALPASLTPAQRRRELAKPVVMLDPGHGGVDPGTIGLSGEYEKTIVLALALAVRDRLEHDGKVRCLLTRQDDTFIPLPDRVAIARANHADLFVSLHADSEADPDIRGLSVYTLSKNASDAEAAALADKENKADLVAGLDLNSSSPEVTNILIDLVQRETLNLSASFAGMVIDEVGHETRILLQNTHRFAGFAVLKAPDVPSVLIETGYLSNPQDEQLLRRPEYRAKLATALAHAIEAYFARTRNATRP